MKKLLVVLVLIGVQSIAQKPFKPGLYKAGAVVKDTSGQYWIAKVDMKAIVPPADGKYWFKLFKMAAYTVTDTCKQIRYKQN